MASTIFGEHVKEFNPENESGWTTITFKWNISNEEQDTEFVSTLLYFAKRYSKNQCYASAGIHKNGINMIPHIHLHLGFRDFVPDKDSNASRSLAKYCDSVDGWKPDGVIQQKKHAEDSSNLEKCLKYPWKEGNIIEIKQRNVYALPESIKLYMLESAKALYASSLLAKRQADKKKDKYETIMGQIASIVGDDTFSSYQQYKEHVYSIFYKDLELSKYPNPPDFMRGVQKVAIFKKIVSPWYFDRS